MIDDATRIRMSEVQKKRFAKKPIARTRYVGSRFGRLVVTDVVLESGDKVRVSCDCGVDKEVRINNLRSGKTISCGCQNNENRINSAKQMQLKNKKMYPKSTIPEPVWKKILDCAKNRKIKVELIKEEAYALLLDQHCLCALSGLEISLPSAPSDSNNFTASLDRIDPDLGYKMGNVQWVHKTVNLMKNAVPQDIFVSMCHQIASNTVIPVTGRRELCKKYINVWQRHLQKKS